MEQNLLVVFCNELSNILTSESLTKTRDFFKEDDQVKNFKLSKQFEELRKCFINETNFDNLNEFEPDDLQELFFDVLETVSKLWDAESLDNAKKSFKSFFWKASVDSIERDTFEVMEVYIDERILTYGYTEDEVKLYEAACNYELKEAFLAFMEAKKLSDEKLRVVDEVLGSILAVLPIDLMDTVQSEISNIFDDERGVPLDNYSFPEGQIQRMTERRDNLLDYLKGIKVRVSEFEKYKEDDEKE